MTPARGGGDIVEPIEASELVESELDLEEEPYEEVIVIDLRGFTAEELSFN